MWADFPLQTISLSFFSLSHEPPHTFSLSAPGGMLSAGLLGSCTDMICKTLNFSVNADKADVPYERGMRETPRLTHPLVSFHDSSHLHQEPVRRQTSPFAWKNNMHVSNKQQQLLNHTQQHPDTHTRTHTGPMSTGTTTGGEHRILNERGVGGGASVVQGVNSPLGIISGLTITVGGAALRGCLTHPDTNTCT